MPHSNEFRRPLRIPEDVRLGIAAPPAARAGERGSWLLNFVLAKAIPEGQELLLYVHGKRNNRGVWGNLQIDDPSKEGYVCLKKASGETLRPIETSDDGGLLVFEAPEGGLGRGELVIVSTESIVPTTAYTGPHAYPQNIPALLRSNSVKVYEVDAPRLAAEAGNARTAGTCLVAAVSWHLKVAEEMWGPALRDVFPGKILDVNLRAFALARRATRPSRS